MITGFQLDSLELRNFRDPVMLTDIFTGKRRSVLTPLDVVFALLLS